MQESKRCQSDRIRNFRGRKKNEAAPNDHTAATMLLPPEAICWIFTNTFRNFLSFTHKCMLKKDTGLKTQDSLHFWVLDFWSVNKRCLRLWWAKSGSGNQTLNHEHTAFYRKTRRVNVQIFMFHLLFRAENDWSCTRFWLCVYVHVAACFLHLTDLTGTLVLHIDRNRRYGAAGCNTHMNSRGQCWDVKWSWVIILLFKITDDRFLRFQRLKCLIGFQLWTQNQQSHRIYCLLQKIFISLQSELSGLPSSGNRFSAQAHELNLLTKQSVFFMNEQLKSQFERLQPC